MPFDALTGSKDVVFADEADDGDDIYCVECESDFLTEHPLFAEKINVRRTAHDVESEWLQTRLTPFRHCDIESEWDFAVGYGYKEGSLDALNRLESDMDSRVLEGENDE